MSSITKHSSTRRLFYCCNLVTSSLYPSETLTPVIIYPPLSFSLHPSQPLSSPSPLSSSLYPFHPLHPSHPPLTLSTHHHPYPHPSLLQNGDLNVSFTNIRKRKRRFIADIFTTLMDMKVISVT